MVCRVSVGFPGIHSLARSLTNSLLRSSDGNVLMVSSADGFCSVVCFENGELGVPIVEATKTPGEEHMEKSEVSEVTTTIPTVPTSAMVLDPPIVEPSSSSSSTLAISDVTVKTLTTSMGTGTLTAEQDTTAADPNKKRRIMPTFVSTVTSMGDVGGNNQ